MKKIRFATALSAAATVSWADFNGPVLDADKWPVKYAAAFTGFDINGYAGERDIDIQGNRWLLKANMGTISVLYGAPPSARATAMFEFTAAEG